MSIKAIPQVLPPTVCLQPGASVLDALRLMLDKEVNHIPVCSEDNVFVGIVSTNQVLLELIPASARVEHGLQNLRFAGDALPMLTARLHELERCEVGRIAQKNIPVLNEDTPILEAALLLTQSTAPLPVVGSDGRVRGMLSRRALLAYLAQQTEE